MNKLKLFYKKIRAALLLCLVLLLTALSGCTTKARIEYKYLFPPQAYLTPCERTEFNGTTYGDAIEHLIKVISERDLCASQIDSIREWQAQMREK
ncbi:Rz1-like lysis system protein LysC [Pasteurellaceae bacterium 22721_9_1]